MKVWGLTGGIGMGKTTTAQMLRELGAKVIDTDDLARQIVEPGEPALAEIKLTFGSQVMTLDGRLGREELAKLVFSDAAARLKLEQILHPRIRTLWLEQIESWRAGGENLAVVAIPMLFETHAEAYFDKVICSACLRASQHERLMARGWTPGHIVQRLAAQWPIAEKIERSDFVLWTEGNLEVLSRQVERILPRKD